MNVIRLSRVCLGYEGKSALTDLDWTVRSGESLGADGRQRGREDDVMSIINGYRWPTSGGVEVVGESSARPTFASCEGTSGW